MWRVVRWFRGELGDRRWRPDDDQDRLVEWIRELEQRVLVLSVAMRAGAAAAAPAVRPVESIDHCQVSDDRVGGLATIDLRVTVSNNHPLVAATLGFFKAPPVPPASGATGGGG